jgi:hypothetical protein
MKPSTITIAVLIAMLVSVPLLLKMSGPGTIRPLPEVGDAMDDIDEFLT